MEHVTRYCKFVSDNSGVTTEIPIILTEQGPLQPLALFLWENRRRSKSWMVKLNQAVSLLLDYMSANRDIYASPEEMFSAFVERLYSGTAGMDGLDPSSLYWTGRTTSTVGQLLGPLNEFSDWMVSKNTSSRPLNPWRQATRSEEMLAWAAWYHARDKSFLGHTWKRDAVALQMSRARQVLLRRTPVVDRDQIKHFPPDRIGDLLFNGFVIPGKLKKHRIEERINLRDVLITMLLHYGGLRISEPFHLYVHDVVPDLSNPSMARVRIYHPTDGTAPGDWRDARGEPIRCKRGAYLKGKYGLLPRTEYRDTAQMYAGWKENLVDDTDKCMDVNWFPSWSGKLFWKLWVRYLIQRATLSRNDHPFAFVTLEGKPYSMDSYEKAHACAVERISLSPAKHLGTTPHGHRHAYGQRLADFEIDPIFRKKALHHKSKDSQSVYTEPDRVKLQRVIEAASLRADARDARQIVDPRSYGLEDDDIIELLVRQDRRK